MGLVPGLAFIAVLATGLVGSLTALLSSSGEAWAERQTWRSLVNGSAMQSVSEVFSNGFPFASSLVVAGRTWDWLALGDLGAQVSRGCGNWLFLKEELRRQAGGEEALAARAGLAAAVDRVLRARDIALIIVVAPDKSRIAAQTLCGLERPTSAQSRLGLFHAALAQAGVRFVDLAEAIAAVDGERYFRTDTHWNETGAAAAAEALARYIEAAGLAPRARRPFERRLGARSERVGDLIRLAGLAGVPRPWRPEGDWVSTTTIVEAETDGGDLLAEAGRPGLVVAGSSFSRNANFTGFLALALAAPVVNAATEGGGFARAIRTYLADETFTETPARVLVWEVPERVLDAPLDPEEIDWMRSLGERRP
jgi:alginate O-acetyltransferase complex protein AlgJ